MKKILIPVAAAIMLTACNNEDIIIPDDPVALHISATIGVAASRANDTIWDVGDEIGITMYEGTGTTTRYSNIRYTYDPESEDDSFYGDTLYCKNKTASYTLSAYYPFTGVSGTAPGIISASTDAEFQSPENQPKIDFLIARKSSLSSTTPDINLEFSHKMSRLMFIFKKGFGLDQMDDVVIESCTITGFSLQGTFDPSKTQSTATPCTPTGSAAPLTIPVSEYYEFYDDTLTLPIILFPHPSAKAPAAGAVVLTINDNAGQSYSCILNPANRFILAAGTSYQFEIILNKTGLAIGSSSIIPWESATENPVKIDASSSDDPEPDAQ